MTARTYSPTCASAALAVSCLAALAANAAWADDGMAERALAAEAGHAALHHPAAADAGVTLRSETQALFTDTVSAPAAAGGLRYNEVTGWLSPDKPSSVGLTLGVLSAGGAEASRSAALAYDLGLRWRTRLEPRVHLDVQAWTRNPQQPAWPDAMGLIWSREPASVGTRVEVQWKASRTGGLVPEFGAIGVQLQGNAKLLLRARHGGPMVYYRAKF